MKVISTALVLLNLVLLSDRSYCSSNNIGGLVEENMGDVHQRARHLTSELTLMPVEEEQKFQSLLKQLDSGQLEKLNGMYAEQNEASLKAINNAANSRQKRNTCRSKFHDCFSGTSKAVGLVFGGVGALVQLVSAAPGVPCEVAGYLSAASVGCYGIGGLLYYLGTESTNTLERLVKEQYEILGNNQQRQGLISREMSLRLHQDRERGYIPAGGARARVNHSSHRDDEEAVFVVPETVAEPLKSELSSLRRQMTAIQKTLAAIDKRGEAPANTPQERVVGEAKEKEEVVISVGSHNNDNNSPQGEGQQLLGDE